MDLKNIWSCLMISVFVTTCHAYWWSPASSTEAPVKHIPLGYFRTYTYQPVGAVSPLSFSILGTAVNPFNWPSRPPSAPVLSGPRYEIVSHTTSTEHSKPPPPPPTTTTTTTTTTSTEPPSPPPPPLPQQQQHQHQQPSPIPLINSPNSINIAGTRYLDPQAAAFAQQQYYGGLYNRRSLPYYQQPPNYIRPYPYPDYTGPGSSQKSQSVQFVPCMCPINLAQMPNDLAETRNIPDGEEMTIPKSTDSPNPNEDENSVDDIVVDRDEDLDKKSL